MTDEPTLNRDSLAFRREAQRELRACGFPLAIIHLPDPQTMLSGIKSADYCYKIEGLFPQMPEVHTVYSRDEILELIKQASKARAPAAKGRKLVLARRSPSSSRMDVTRRVAERLIEEKKGELRAEMETRIQQLQTNYETAARQLVQARRETEQVRATATWALQAEADALQELNALRADMIIARKKGNLFDPKKETLTQRIAVTATVDAVVRYLELVGEAKEAMEQHFLPEFLSALLDDRLDEYFDKLAEE